MDVQHKKAKYSTRNETNYFSSDYFAENRLFLRKATPFLINAYFNRVQEKIGSNNLVWQQIKSS